MGKKYTRKDSLYNKAKEEGYNSRAAYKLKEIQKKYYLIKKDSSILELGCNPGSWSEVALEYLSTGTLVGIDILDIPNLPKKYKVTPQFIKGDIMDDGVVSKALSFSDKFDLIMSDMSPNLSGVRFRDIANMSSLVERIREICSNSLSSGGSLICKVFTGGEVDEEIRKVKVLFDRSKLIKLKSTRGSSTELYLVCIGFKK